MSTSHPPCGQCGRPTRTRDDGHLTRHRTQADPTAPWCPGSLKPRQEKP